MFSDYCRPAIRLAALMGERVIHVMTHDSIGLGEDGPTHQPVEHLAALRAIPNLQVFRPADAVETAECWQLALRSQRPPERAGADAPEPAAARADASTTATAAPRGAYEIVAGRRQGRRLDLRHRLGSRDRGRGARSCSPRDGIVGARRLGAVLRAVRWQRRRPTRRAVIGDATVKVAVEAAVRQGWDAIIGADGAFVGMTGFGASAPYKDLYKHFGITPEAVAEAALASLAKLDASMQSWPIRP